MTGLALALAAAAAASPPSLPGTPSAAHTSHVVVVADTDNRLVDEAVAALAQTGAAVELRLVASLKGGTPRAALDDADTIYLAAGKASARVLAQAEGSAAVAHKAAFLVKSSDVPAGLAAVTLDAPLDAQLQWLKTAFPGRSRVIVPRSAHDVDAALVKAAAAAGLEAVLVDVRSPGEAVPAVNAALRKPGGPAAILLVPDAVAVTPDTVAPLAQAALSARTPVVGFSTYFLKVGALAAVAVDVAAMAKQALALAGTSNADGANGAVPPDSGHLVVDGRLAERLGVPVRSGPGVEVRR